MRTIRPAIRAPLSACAVILALLLGSSRFSGAVSEGSIDRGFAIAVWELVNCEREERGLPPLVLDFDLCAPANARAKECAASDPTSASAAHTRPDGRSFATALTECGITGWSLAAENLLISNDPKLSARKVVDAWMASTSGHREALLSDRITVMGVGAYHEATHGSGAGTAVICMLMTGGCPAGDPYAPAENGASPGDSSGATPSPTASGAVSPSPSSDINRAQDTQNAGALTATIRLGTLLAPRVDKPHSIQFIR